MIYSINQLTRKSEQLKELTDNQIKVNQKSEQNLKNKKDKIEEQNMTINELNNECANLELLIKQYHLEDKAKENGLNLDK